MSVYRHHLLGTSASNFESVSGAYKIDILITVHDALNFAKVTLERLERFTGTSIQSYIVINDGSLQTTTSWLLSYSQDKQAFQLVEFNANKGYTRSLNFGVRISSGDYLVIMNSDVLVSAGWLDGMLECMHSFSEAGIVGPLSNAGGFQSVPALYGKGGDFAVNIIPQGLNVDTISSGVRNVSEGACLPVELVNGFLYMVKKYVFETIGLYDTERFAVGYGEEDDFCLRARSAGFTILVSESVYVYHFKSKSFGKARRSVLLRQGIETNFKKHSRQKVVAMWRNMSKLQALQEVRARICKSLYQGVGC